MITAFSIAALALLVDRLFGYSQRIVGVIGHPVIWIGALIGWLDRRLNKPELTAMQLRLRGAAVVGILFVVAGVPALLLMLWLRSFAWGWVIEGLLAATLLAQKSLRNAVREVADALFDSLPEGRRAVGQIVGRDTSRLDEAGVARAAVETLAESSSDGVIAPLFYLLLFGLPGIAIFKAINTADSMIGHKTPKYLYFGWAAARTDDVLCWIPSRISTLFISIACLLIPGTDAGRSLRTAWRDAPKHASPNAGWPEAAMAGALGLSLGGKRTYSGEEVDLPNFGGDGRQDASVSDMRRGLRLYATMLDAVFLATLIGLAVVAGFRV